MTFTYPTVFTPYKNDKGYHVTFPGLQCYEADGPNLKDTMRHAREAVYSRLYLEIEEKTFEFPPQTHTEGIRLEEKEFPKHITVTIKLSPDND